MTTHTPGPWVWIEGSDAINRRWDNRDWTVASVGNHRLGWHEYKNSEGREAGANARLIAAAPELLEAAYAALTDADAWREQGNQDKSWAPALRLAIAKAVQS